MQLLILRVSTWTNRLGSSLFGQTRGPPPSPRQASLPKMIVSGLYYYIFLPLIPKSKAIANSPPIKDRNSNCTTFLSSCADKGLIEAEPRICITKRRSFIRNCLLCQYGFQLIATHLLPSLVALSQSRHWASLTMGRETSFSTTCWNKMQGF